MPNEKKETSANVPIDVSIAVSYARPRMVFKDHRTSEIRMYSIEKMETIQINGRDAGLLIKGNEIIDEETEPIDPKEAIEIELQE